MSSEGGSERRDLRALPALLEVGLFQLCSRFCLFVCCCCCCCFFSSLFMAVLIYPYKSTIYIVSVLQGVGAASKH